MNGVAQSILQPHAQIGVIHASRGNLLAICFHQNLLVRKVDESYVYLLIRTKHRPFKYVPVYKRTTVQQNFDHLHFFLLDTITGQQTSSI